MVAILTAMKAFGVSLGEADYEEHAVKLRAESSQLGGIDFVPDVCHSIQKLWNDTGVKESYGRSREYRLNDSAAYFMEALERLYEGDYVPTEHDLIWTRVRTTGIIETSFKYKHLNFTLIDIAGERSERQNGPSASKMSLQSCFVLTSVLMIK